MKMHLVIILTIASVIQVIDCSVNPIYELVANSDSKKCYTCHDDCSNQVLQNCSGGAKCFSKTSRSSGNITSLTKGCLETNADTFCDTTDKDITSCYICDGDFCNVAFDDTIDTGVSRCYLCDGQCETPLAQHDCEEVLTPIEGRTVKAACLTYTQIANGEFSESRGCVVDDPNIRQTCAAAPIIYEGVTCSICDTELCNGHQEEENFVDECYYCTGTCNTATVQNCKESLGEDAKSKCIAVEFDNGGEIIIEKSCVELNNTVESGCNLINTLGGNCTICDTNLCNGDGDDDDDDENYVDECYYCDFECKKPLAIHQCREVLGENAKSKCIATEFVQDGRTVQSRGCIEVNENVQRTCDEINSIGGNCTICDTNLCNDIDDKSNAGQLQMSIYVLLVMLLTTVWNCKIKQE